MNISRFILLLLISCFSLQGQAQTVIRVKASVNKQRVLIGEPLELTLVADLPEDGAKTFFTIDTIGHFEITEAPHIDTSEKPGYTEITGIYKLTSFDSGHWTIPAYVMAPGVKTDSIAIDVVFSDFDPAKPYNDIKDVIPVEEKKKSFPWLLFAGGAVVLIGLLYLLFRNKKKEPAQAVVVIPTDPFKEAMQGLEAWKGKTSDVKAYYSGLVSVFRVYIFRKKALLSLQKTTDDLIVQLASVPWEKDLSNRLNQALRLSDFVKFAKFEPSGSDHINCYNVIKEAIEKTEQIP